MDLKSPWIKRHLGEREVAFCLPGCFMGLLKPVWLMFPKPLKCGLQLTRGYSFPGPLTLGAVARLRTISLHITDKPTMANNARSKKHKSLESFGHEMQFQMRVFLGFKKPRIFFFLMTSYTSIQIQTLTECQNVF